MSFCVVVVCTTIYDRAKFRVDRRRSWHRNRPLHLPLQVGLVFAHTFEENLVCSPCFFDPLEEKLFKCVCF